MTLELSHFEAVLVFAALTSIVFGITQRSSPRDQLLYGLRCFPLFVLAVIAAGWLMWLIRR